MVSNPFRVTSLDNLNDYYDPTLKQARLDRLTPELFLTHVDKHEGICNISKEGR